MGNWKYFLIYRPPGYGTMPAGHTAFDGGLPQKKWDSQHGPVRAFGWVKYSEPLTIEQVWKWELEPDDPVEWAHLAFWCYADRNADRAAWLEQDYIQAYRSGTGRIPEALLEPTRILSEV